MRVLFDGRLSVHYWQGYLESAVDGEVAEAGAEPTGGLIDASVPGRLILLTGLHTGDVPLRIVLHEWEPPVDDAWEYVIEVPFRPLTEDLLLAEWGGGGTSVGRVPVTDYRVRYSGVGVDAARDADTLEDGAEAIDRFELVLWPAPPSPAMVVREPERSHGPVQGRSAKADAAIAAAERVSRAAREGALLSGGLVTLEFEVALPAERSIEDAWLTNLTWTGGDSMESIAERPGEHFFVAGFGYADLDLELRRLDPGRLVEVGWDLQVGWPTRVVETGASLRVLVDGDTLRLRHDVPVEWADDLRVVWVGLLEKLVQRLDVDPWQYEHWTIAQERGYPEPEPWDPSDDFTFVDDVRDYDLPGFPEAVWSSEPWTEPDQSGWEEPEWLGMRVFDVLHGLSPERQLEISLWATTRAWERAGIADWPGARDALAAVGRGERPQPPYDDPQALMHYALNADSARPGEPVQRAAYANQLLTIMVEQDGLAVTEQTLQRCLAVFDIAERGPLLQDLHAAFPELA